MSGTLRQDGLFESTQAVVARQPLRRVDNGFAMRTQHRHIEMCSDVTGGAGRDVEVRHTADRSAGVRMQQGRKPLQAREESQQQQCQVAFRHGVRQI